MNLLLVGLAVAVPHSLPGSLQCAGHRWHGGAELVGDLPERVLIAILSQREQREPVSVLPCLIAHRQHYIDPPFSPQRLECDPLGARLY